MLTPNKAHLVDLHNGHTRYMGIIATDHDIRNWIKKNLLSIRIEAGEWVVYVRRGKQQQTALFVPKSRQVVAQRAWNKLINGRDPAKYATPHNPSHQAIIEQLSAL